MKGNTCRDSVSGGIIRTLTRRRPGICGTVGASLGGSASREGVVRVWVPFCRGFLPSNIGGITAQMCLAGLVVNCAHTPCIRMWMWVWVLMLLTLWLPRLVRSLVRPCCVAVYDEGIAITRGRLSSYLRWDDIHALRRSYAFIRLNRDPTLVIDVAAYPGRDADELHFLIIRKAGLTNVRVDHGFILAAMTWERPI